MVEAKKISKTQTGKLVNPSFGFMVLFLQPPSFYIMQLHVNSLITMRPCQLETLA